MTFTKHTIYCHPDDLEAVQATVRDYGQHETCAISYEVTPLQHMGERGRYCVQPSNVWLPVNTHPSRSNIENGLAGYRTYWMPERGERQVGPPTFGDALGEFVTQIKALGWVDIRVSTHEPTVMPFGHTPPEMLPVKLEEPMVTFSLEARKKWEPNSK